MSEDKKSFFKKFYEGILNLSVLQQLNVKKAGILGGIVGLILAFITLLYQKMWGFGIFIFFVIITQFISYIGLRQHYIQIKKMLEESEKIKENNNQEVGL